jgi:hypothetical protein
METNGEPETKEKKEPYMSVFKAGLSSTKISNSHIITSEKETLEHLKFLILTAIHGATKLITLKT